jgi:hypothetical protein
VAELEPYQPEHATALHAVEKGEGAPDRTPVGQSEQVSAGMLAAVRTVFPDADDHTPSGRDIVDEFLETTDEVGATAIAYCSHGGEPSQAVPLR